MSRSAPPVYDFELSFYQALGIRWETGRRYRKLEHGGDVNAPQKNNPQKVPQVDVSENIGEERRRQKNKPDFGNRSNCFPNEAVGFNSFHRQVPASKYPDEKDSGAQHLAEKYEPGQHR